MRDLFTQARDLRVYEDPDTTSNLLANLPIGHKVVDQESMMAPVGWLEIKFRDPVGGLTIPGYIQDVNLGLVPPPTVPLPSRRTSTAPAPVPWKDWRIWVIAILVLVLLGFLLWPFLFPRGDGLSDAEAQATAQAYAATTVAGIPPKVETQVVVQTQVVRETQIVEVTSPAVSPSETPNGVVPTIAPTSAPAALTPAPTSGAPGTTTYQPFTPDWGGLDSACPDRAKFLSDHGLTEAQVIWHPAPSVSWEPCEFVIELKPEYYGQVTISLVNGYAYTLAPVGTDVTNMWGGDPAMSTSTLQWGFTARWAPDYQDLVYPWLQANNPCEWLVRDWRFGRYWRLPNLGIAPPEVPYYNRVGPYSTLPGNVSCTGWVPPSVDQTVPMDYLQASAMLGGLANEAEWKHSGDGLNWSWRYNFKVAGSATYCPSGMPCWQTSYVPPNSRGYIELWDGTGPRKFYAADLAILMLSNKNSDEFRYHADPNR